MVATQRLMQKRLALIERLKAGDNLKAAILSAGFAPTVMDYGRWMNLAATGAFQRLCMKRETADFATATRRLGLADTMPDRFCQNYSDTEPVGSLGMGDVLGRGHNKYNSVHWHLDHRMGYMYELHCRGELKFSELVQSKIGVK